MSGAPDLDPLAENIEGVVSESHTYSHEIHHKINWGYVALGVGVVAAFYVLHQYLNDDETDEVVVESRETVDEVATVPATGGALSG